MSAKFSPGRIINSSGDKIFWDNKEILRGNGVEKQVIEGAILIPGVPQV